MKITYADEKENRWEWLKSVPIGHEAVLRDGRHNAYLIAKRHGRKIKTHVLANGDYILTVVK